MVTGIGYVRVSTENQLENYSIEEQTDRLKAYCQAKDITLVKIYTDGGYSGGNTNRPALQQMLSDIAYHDIDIVIVYKLDRLSRSQKDTLLLIEDKFLAHKVDFISICENFDTSSPFGRAMIGILSVFAQLEKDQITERFTMGRIGRAKNGYFHGGAYAPTGYDYVEGELVVNEYEAMQVKELYERFAAGHTLHNCQCYMSSKYTTKYGAWTSDTLVRKVLQNEIYIGNITFQGITYPGRHHAIISHDLYNTVQEVFHNSRRNSSSSKRNSFKASTLLSGILYCARCGARYHGEHGNYSCYSRTKGDQKYILDPNCKNKKWKISDLDILVMDCLSSLNFDDLPVKQQQAAVKDHSKRVAEIGKQISNLIDLYQTGSVPLESITHRIQSLSQEKEALLNVSCEKKPSDTDKSSVMFQKKFLELLDTGDLQEKRACISNIIERIQIDGDIVELILK